MKTIQKKQAAAALLCGAMLCGCASQTASIDDEDGEFADPLEPANRVVYKFNKVFDGLLFKPAAQAYDALPDILQDRLSNFVANLKEPRTAVNDFAQLKFSRAGRDLARFGINTVVGVGGMFDVATRMGLHSNDEDTGQTFRHYGMESSYVVLPFLGPSTIMDGVGTAADAFLSPVNYWDEERARIGINALTAIDARAKFLDAEDLIESALDEYSFVRDLYLERRAVQARE